MPELSAIFQATVENRFFKFVSSTDEGAGNFKLPLLLIVMLLQLVFGGAGKLSPDHVLRYLTGHAANVQGVTDLGTFGPSFAILGMGLIFLVPVLGAVLLVLGLLLLIVQRFP